MGVVRAAGRSDGGVLPDETSSAGDDADAYSAGGGDVYENDDGADEEEELRGGERKPEGRPETLDSIVEEREKR